MHVSISPQSDLIKKSHNVRVKEGNAYFFLLSYLLFIFSSIATIVINNDKLFVCEENKDLVGFVMFSYGNPAKCNQICIQEDARLIERGQALLSAAISHGNLRGIEDFACGCADDLPSNIFWKRMGWEKSGERFGISHKNTWKQTRKRIINLYRYQTISLFTTETGIILPKEGEIIAI